MCGECYVSFRATCCGADQNFLSIFMRKVWQFPVVSMANKYFSVPICDVPYHNFARKYYIFLRQQKMLSMTKRKLVDQKKFSRTFVLSVVISEKMWSLSGFLHVYDLLFAWKNSSLSRARLIFLNKFQSSKQFAKEHLSEKLFCICFSLETFLSVFLMLLWSLSGFLHVRELSVARKK